MTPPTSDASPSPDGLATTPAEPWPAPAPTTAPAPDGNAIAVLKAAADLDWQTIDLDLPRRGYVVGVGCEINAACAVVTCECGHQMQITFDGRSRARCAKCRAVFRHVVLIQNEDTEPSSAALLVDQLLREAGLRA